MTKEEFERQYQKNVEANAQAMKELLQKVLDSGMKVHILHHDDSLNGVVRGRVRNYAQKHFPNHGVSYGSYNEEIKDPSETFCVRWVEISGAWGF